MYAWVVLVCAFVVGLQLVEPVLASVSINVQM